MKLKKAKAILKSFDLKHIECKINDMTKSRLTQYYEEVTRLYVHYFKERDEAEIEAYGFLKSSLKTIFIKNGLKYLADEIERTVKESMMGREPVVTANNGKNIN